MSLQVRFTHFFKTGVCSAKVVIFGRLWRPECVSCTLSITSIAVVAVVIENRWKTALNSMFLVQNTLE